MKEDNNMKDDNEDEDDEEHMDDDDGDNCSDPLKSVKAFKKLVVKTLEDNNMADKRACKMEIIDFLNLLKIFNEAGIHFK